MNECVGIMGWLFGHSWQPVLNPERGWNQPAVISVCARCGKKIEKN